MKSILILVFLILSFQLPAQSNKARLVGDWKFYQTDNSSFEFLRLNEDGTGIKCFGRTINGKDTLFVDEITTLNIIKWKVSKGKLILESKNEVIFSVNPEYELTFLENDKIELRGEHLILYLFPSMLNRSKFQRSVIYQRADKILNVYGVTSLNCITVEKDLFTFNQVDSITQLALYKGFEDIIPHIVGCKNSFEYVQKYQDPPYSLLIPTYLLNRSFGFGNKLFYFSFNSAKGDSSETTIAIYYDFDNSMKEYYFSQIEKGIEPNNYSTINEHNVYLTTNYQGKLEGKVFLDNSIIIAYYTREEELIEQLQKCITSFKYK